MSELTTLPEILLKKRKNADRKRLERQKAVKAAKEEAVRAKAAAKRAGKFVRAETLVLNARSARISRQRAKIVARRAADDTLELAPQLVFVVRVPPAKKNMAVPAKAAAVLQVLRLDTVHTGVFTRLTSETRLLLSLVAPWVVVGVPSPLLVRLLFAKRAVVAKTGASLDLNQAVEERFEETGLICIEDLVHEVVAMGPQFKEVVAWLAPFRLNPPVSGYGPQAKLERLQGQRHEAGLDVELVDVDEYIELQN